MLAHANTPAAAPTANSGSFFFSRFVPRHEDELYLEIDDPVLVLDRSEDLWCLGYNMRSGASGIFPAFYTVEVTKEPNPGERRYRTGRNRGGWTLTVLLFCLSPEGRLDRTVPGPVPGLGPGPRPQGQQRALCRHAEGRPEPPGPSFETRFL